MIKTLKLEHYFADDGLILAQTKESVERAIDLLIKKGEETGLEISKEKSKIIIFNEKEVIEKIKDIEVTDTIKYLGVEINNKKNCFKVYKKKVVQKARQMANMTYSMIVQSSNKLLIGKTYWKSIVLPTILYASAIIGFTKQEIEELQKIENSVYRVILGAPKYTQVAALRGEIGASKMETRIRENQIKYMKYIEEHNRNDLLKRILDEKKEIKNEYWIKTSEEFMKNAGLTYNMIRHAKIEIIKDRIQDWDLKNWQKEIQEKSSLKIYKNCKQELKGEEKLYDNKTSSAIMFQARTNNLNLNDRKRFNGEETKCFMCEGENENLNHFILWCRGYEEERRGNLLTQQPYIEDEDKLIGELLFGEKKEEVKELIYKFWKKREARKKELT